MFWMYVSIFILQCKVFGRSVGIFRKGTRYKCGFFVRITYDLHWKVFKVRTGPIG